MANALGIVFSKDPSKGFKKAYADLDRDSAADDAQGVPEDRANAPADANAGHVQSKWW